jgi:hypothetical protein
MQLRHHLKRDTKKARKEMAEKLKKPVSGGLATGGAQLGLGGVVGTAGAAAQYHKGRKAEQGFQKRLKAYRKG